MNKICTTIEQSKKLIELGIDRKTSDMYYWCGEDLRIGGYKAQCEESDIPCWSLAALLGVFCCAELEKDYGTWDDAPNLFYRVKVYKLDAYVTNWHDNPIDACYEMILKLHERKLL